MGERYVRPTVGGWLLPTVVGPWIGVYGAVTAIAALGIDRGIFGKVIGWILGMALGSVWAFAYVLLLLSVDLLLLAMRVRTLPVGRRGWASSALSPLLVLPAYWLAPPYAFYTYGVLGVAIAVIAPMVLVALGVRVVGGQKTLR